MFIIHNQIKQLISSIVVDIQWLFSSFIKKTQINQHCNNLLVNLKTITYK